MKLPSVEELAQEIRRVDGGNTMGAGALAEAIHTYVASYVASAVPGPRFTLKSPASCWCEACDVASNQGWRTRMSLCPACGDKRCPRSLDHVQACASKKA